jgi:hypothetical protein
LCGLKHLEERLEADLTVHDTIDTVTCPEASKNRVEETHLSGIPISIVSSLPAGTPTCFI